MTPWLATLEMYVFFRVFAENAGIQNFAQADILPMAESIS